MPVARLRRYRHFPTIPDAQALVMLLRQTDIAFEIRYQRGVNYDRASHEPDRIEVWIQTTDYAYVQRLEAALTREQALDLAAAKLPNDQLQSIVDQAAPRPAAAQAASGAGSSQPAQAAVPARPRLSPAPSSVSRVIERGLPSLLLAAALVALVFYLLR